VPCTYERPRKRGRITPAYASSRGPGPLAAIGNLNKQQRQHQQSEQEYYRQLRPSQLQPVSTTPDASAAAGLERASGSPVSHTSSREVAVTRNGDVTSKERPPAAWMAFAAASANTIEYLIDVYLQVVYPM
jgi:hypothetical protein